ncbi:threonine synthase, partial [Bacteroidota bacterium]
MTFLSHLECGYCKKEYDADKVFNLCPECSKPLLVRYDLKKAAREFSKEEIQNRPPDLWRYKEMLPVRNEENILTLGEGYSPLFNAS